MSSLPKAIVLDFDGVIVESNQIKHDAFSTIFSDYPDKYDEMMSFHKAHPAMNRHQKFSYIADSILNLSGSWDKSNSLQKKWVSVFENLTQQSIIDCPLVVGALDFLQTFAKTSSLFVASATPHSELLFILKARDLEKYFKGIFGAPTPKVQVLEQICESEGLKKSDTLFIGDSSSDLIAAQNAKIPFIGRLSGENLNAPLLFHDLREIKLYLIKENLNELS